MKRGTTPTHTFELPFDTSILKELKITYAQDDKSILCKRLADCELNGSVAKVKLTQEETFMFDCKKMVQIQLRGLTLGGDAPESDVIIVSVDKCLDDEVLV